MFVLVAAGRNRDRHAPRSRAHNFSANRRNARRDFTDPSLILGIFGNRKFHNFVRVGGPWFLQRVRGHGRGCRRPRSPRAITMPPC